MHSFSNWAERRNKGLQMAQAVVSVYLIQISPSWWNLFQSMCLRQHVICILSIYTALPTRSTKKYKMDICWFFTARYIFLASKQHPACILKNYFSLTVGVWWGRKSRMQPLRWGRQRASWRPPLTDPSSPAPGGGRALQFSIALQQTAPTLEV